MSTASDVASYVAMTISCLQVDSPKSKADLAKLRRACGKSPESTPEVWPITLNNLPDNLSGYYSKNSYHPSDAEWAIHNALTLYAIHSQGTTQSPNVKGVSFGKAIGNLAKNKGDNDETIKKRFNNVVTSSDTGEISNHMRSLIQLMNAEGSIGFDYTIFAKDLYLLTNPDYRDKIFFRWGEDFFGYK